MAVIVVYAILLIVLTPPLGAYMYRVYTRERTGRVEGVIYRLIGVDPNVEQTWRRYASSVLWFSAIGMIFIYVIFRVQHHLPLNPNGIAAVNPYVSFNTAASFITNTNWQAYGGETTMSYLSQMLALTFQNFLSAAVGMAVLIAMIRGFMRSGTQTLGNFWRDTVRGVVYILFHCRSVVGHHPDEPRRGADPRANLGRVPGSRASSRSSPAAPWPARSPSSSWGRTAAASST